MLNFVFNNPTVIYFGRGQVNALEKELRERAKNILIVTGSGSVRKNGIFGQVMEEVSRSGCTHKELSGIVPNPRLESVYRGIEICRNEKIDFILAVGGGSVIDAAKAIAAGAKYKGDVWDFFEKEKRPKKAIPLGSVLTLSATGSEMNTNSVITNERTKRKLYMSSPLVRPVFSVLDPAYTFTVPKFHTAAGIADIMAHVFETYLAPIGHTELMDRLSEAILKTCVTLGPVVCEDPYNYEARANIMWSSTLALNGIVSSGTAGDWLCHGIEHELSAIYDISHGAGLAIILPAFIKVTSENYSLGKYEEYGANIWGITGGDSHKVADEAVERTRSFFRSLGLPTSLKEADITDEHFDRIVDNITSSRGEAGCYKQLDGRDIRRILELSL